MNSRLERLEEAANKFKEVCENFGIISLDKIYKYKNHDLKIYPQVFMHEETYIELFGKTEAVNEFRRTMHNGISYCCVAERRKLK